MSNHISQSIQHPSRQAKGHGRLRWWVVWTLFFSTVTNYISRQSFSVLSPMIAAKYHFSHTDIAKILGSFQLSYAITWLIGGICIDVVGTRLALALAATFWSIVNILMGFANSVFSFEVFRFLLGIGEGFNWPGASKAVADWFPREERSMAVAIFDSGSSVGGALAALAIPLIALKFGYRWAFVFPGIAGLLWLLVWLRVYYPLDRHPRVTPQEIAFIRVGQDPGVKSTPFGLQRCLALARDSNVWAVVLGRALTDPIWWFYVGWLPQYLSDARGFSLKAIALFAWIPFVAADLGNFTGAFVSGYCIRRGASVIKARLWVCTVSCLPVLAGIPASRVHNAYFAMALICVALWGYASWSTIGLTLPSDLFPQDVVATVTGLSGCAASLAGAGFTFLVGILVDRFSYGPAFAAAALLPILATICVFFLIHAPESKPPNARPISLDRSAIS